jgi:hypothetical protein
MKKRIILAIGLILVLIFLTSFLLALAAPDFFNLSSSSYSNISSHTKAICDSENFCQDYEIFCDNKKVVKISPITGASVQYSSAWKDLRDENLKNEMCYE